MLFLMTHYASPMHFSYDSLEQAKSIINRWYNAIREVKIIEDDECVIEGAIEPLLDNMNTPKSISILSAVVDSINKATSDKSEIATRFVNTCRKFLGILTKDPGDWFNKVDDRRRNMIEAKIRRRNEAREEKDFETADKIKMELLADGIILEDTKNGTIWKAHS
jgi:cysteinyl-tRNA synthetase